MRMFHRSQFVAPRGFPEIGGRAPQRGQLPDVTFEPGAPSIFLYDRMIGVAGEIDDHLSRRRSVDTPMPICALRAPRSERGNAA